MKLRGQKTLALLLALLMLFSLLPAAAMAEDLVEDNVLEEQEPVEQMVEEGPSEPQQTAEDLTLVEEEEQEETEQPAENAENADNADNAENADNEAEASRNEEEAAETKDESADNAEIAGLSAREEAQLGASAYGVLYLYYEDDSAAIAQSATQGSADCTIVESSESEVTWDSGWYVVEGDVTINGRITVNGDVNLILADGATLNANKGITVAGSNSLSIYGQNLGTGELIATSSGFNAAIGGYWIWNQDSVKNAGSITIHGGKVTASIDGAEQNGCGAAIGGSAGGSGGTITINGGVIVAANTYHNEDYGFAGAAIGGGSEDGAGTITINGGTVTATGGYMGAAIGCGVTKESSGTITINGGTVTATGGDGGPGIGDSGGMVYGNFGSVSIFINNGTVVATGGIFSAGIGSGYQHVAGTVNINGGIVSAVGGGIIEDWDTGAISGRCPGIGGGYESSYNGTVTLGSNVTVYAGDSANPQTDVTGSFASSHTQPYVRTEAAPPIIAVTGVSLDKTDAQTVTVGGNVAFTATVAPDKATDKTVKWSVGGTNPSAVKLYSDANCSTEVGTDATDTLTVYAKGISAGSATVTVTSNANDSATASCTVTVKEPVAGVSLDKNALALGVNGTETLTAKILPENATDKTVKWSVDGNSVALYKDEACNQPIDDTTPIENLTVYVKGLAEGEATIIVTTTDGEKTAYCNVTVFPEHKHDGVIFQPWTSTGLPTSGDWYLTNNVTVTTGTIVDDTLNLCLNGKTITFANGGTPSYPGITVTGGKTLNLYDFEGGGAITRGEGCSGNGVILNAGTKIEGAKTQFNMYGGTISGHDIGVYVNDNSNPSYEPGSEFKMYGGAIVNNTPSSGIYLSGTNATVTLAGRVDVSGNGYDIDVGSDKVINIESNFALADSSKKIGVQVASETKPFTSGFKSAVSGKTPADFFASKNIGYTVGWNADESEARLLETVTVTFMPNEGTGSMDPQIIAKNTATTLTANAFTREGYTFNGWNTQADGTGDPYADGASVTLSSSLTLYAQWKEEGVTPVVSDEVYFNYLQGDFGNYYKFRVVIRVPDASYVPSLNLGGFRNLTASEQAAYDASDSVAYTVKEVSTGGAYFYDYNIKIFAQYLDTPIYFKVMHNGEEVVVGKHANDNGNTMIMHTLEDYGSGYSMGDYVRVMALTNSKYVNLANSIGAYAEGVQGLK